MFDKGLSIGALLSVFCCGRALGGIALDSGLSIGALPSVFRCKKALGGIPLEIGLSGVCCTVGWWLSYTIGLDIPC